MAYNSNKDVDDIYLHFNILNLSKKNKSLKTGISSTGKISRNEKYTFVLISEIYIKNKVI